MKRIFKFAIVGGGIVALLLIGLLAITENRLPIFEYADTRFASAFSFDAVGKIKSGDSVEKVQTNLGQPLWKMGCGGCWEPDRKCTTVDGYESCEEWHIPKNCHADCVATNQKWEYTDDGASPIWDFAWREFSVELRDGKVSEIVDVWRYD